MNKRCAWSFLEHDSKARSAAPAQRPRTRRRAFAQVSFTELISEQIRGRNDKACGQRGARLMSDGSRRPNSVQLEGSSPSRALDACHANAAMHETLPDQRFTLFLAMLDYDNELYVSD